MHSRGDNYWLSEDPALKIFCKTEVEGFLYIYFLYNYYFLNYNFWILVNSNLHYSNNRFKEFFFHEYRNNIIEPIWEYRKQKVFRMFCLPVWTISEDLFGSLRHSFNFWTIKEIRTSKPYTFIFFFLLHEYIYELYMKITDTHFVNSNIRNLLGEDS